MGGAWGGRVRQVGRRQVVVPANGVLLRGRARALRQLLPRLVLALQPVQPV